MPENLEPVDRITDMLTKRQPSMSQVSMALGEALAGGRGMGDTLNMVRAQQLQEEQVLAQAVQQKKTGKRLDRQLSLDEEKLSYKKFQDGVAQGDASMIVANQFMDKYGVENQPALAAALIKDERTITKSNARSIVAEHAKKLGFKPAKVPLSAAGKEAFDVSQGIMTQEQLDEKRMKRGDKGYYSPRNIIDLGGQVIGYAQASKDTPGFVYYGKDGSKMDNLPPGATMAPLSAGAPKPATDVQLQKTARDMLEIKQGVRGLGEYMKDIADTKQGWAGLAEQLLAKSKVVFGSEALTPTDIATLRQRGELMPLVGQLRQSMVGGGAMSDFDVLNIITGLGGDFSVTRSKQAASSLLQRIMRNNIERYNMDVPFYNEQLELAGRLGRGAKRADSIQMPAIFDEQTMPKVGEIRKGHTFLGGDPSDPTSWEKT